MLGRGEVLLRKILILDGVSMGAPGHTTSFFTQNFPRQRGIVEPLKRILLLKKGSSEISLSDRTRASSANNSKKIPFLRQVLEPTCRPRLRVYPNFDLPRPLRKFRRCSRKKDRRRLRSSPIRVPFSAVEHFGGPKLRRILLRSALLAGLKYAWGQED